jgi:hypothetical protein
MVLEGEEVSLVKVAVETLERGKEQTNKTHALEGDCLASSKRQDCF